MVEIKSIVNISERLVKYQMIETEFFINAYFHPHDTREPNNYKVTLEGLYDSLLFSIEWVVSTILVSNWGNQRKREDVIDERSFTRTLI